MHGGAISLELLGATHPTAKLRNELDETLDLAARVFKDGPVGTCLRDVRNAVFELGKPSCTLASIASVMSQLKGNILTELEACRFVRVADGSEHLVENEKLFGDAVYTAFPSARLEIKEAGNCLAVGCHTAAVFHLMRASEHGLRCLGCSVGVTSSSIPLEFQEWQNLIEQLKSRVDRAAISKWSQPSKGNALAFFSSTIADYYAFKGAVRNVTMHTRTGGTYDSAAATDVSSRVRECLARLARYISEGDIDKALLVESEFVR